MATDAMEPAPHEVELLYDPGCPNVDLARRALREALASLGLAPSWTEQVGSRGLGSPTILVDGRDVAPHGPAGTCQHCRVYVTDSGDLEKAPSKEMIINALTRRG